MPLPWLSSSSPSSSPSSPNTHHHQRRLTRAKQLRHLRDRDLNHFLSHATTTTSSSSSSHPLPLPDLSALFSTSSNDAGDRFRLPSPTGPPKNTDRRSLFRFKDRGPLFHDQPPSSDARISPRDRRQSNDSQRRVDARWSVDVPRGADPQRSIHRAETWSSTSVQHNIKNVDQGQEYFSTNIAFRSAPPSANASPMLSPQRIPHGDPFPLFHVESKPWSDTALSSAFPYAIPPDSNVANRDSFSLRFPPGKSFVPPRNSVSGPPSPRHPKLSIEVSPMHHDNNAPVNVHPLPLPPTPSSLGQPSPVPQVAAKPEFFPMKSQWTKRKLIGRGTFGSVYVATNRETGALCAMKEVELCPDDPKSAECMKQLQQEINVLSHLKHPNIVQYYGSEIVDDRFYIYLEYVYPGSINKYIREHCGAMTEAVVRNFTRHILSGLAYLHGRKTIHRDIKGANLLVDACGVVKLADFGMAKHLTGQAADLSLKGSPHWMAPELMNAVMQKDNSVDLAFAVDIWSLGCTIIEMLTGKPPWSGFEGAAAMFKVLRDSPPIPETLSAEGKDFLGCCFCRNPADRPPACKLLDHPFLRNSQQQDVPSSNQLPSPNLTDKAHSPKETYEQKLDKMPLSPSRYPTNGKGGNNETSNNLLSHPETNEQVAGVSSRHSPRSILEPMASLSPPHSSPALKLLISGNASNIMMGAAKKAFSAKLWT